MNGAGVLAVRRPTLPSTHDVKETLGQQHYLCCAIHRSATYHVILSQKMRFRKKLRIGSGGYEVVLRIGSIVGVKSRLLRSVLARR
jgi:hypothetical protein